MHTRTSCLSTLVRMASFTLQKALLCTRLQGYFVRSALFRVVRAYSDFNFFVRTRKYEKRSGRKQPLTEK